MATVGLSIAAATHVVSYGGDCVLHYRPEHYAFGAATSFIVVAQLVVVGVMTLDAARRQLGAALARRQRISPV